MESCQESTRQILAEVHPDEKQKRHAGGTEKRAEAIADYLEQKHWSNDPEDGKARSIKRGCLMKSSNQEEESKGRQTKPFPAEELKEALKLSKKGKAPGPDNVRMELIKWLDQDNRGWLLNIMNGWWSRGKLPDELYPARVASIYKKGDTSRAENYRPIWLLSSLRFI